MKAVQSMLLDDCWIGLLRVAILHADDIGMASRGYLHHYGNIIVKAVHLQMHLLS